MNFIYIYFYSGYLVNNEPVVDLGFIHDRRFSDVVEAMLVEAREDVEERRSIELREASSVLLVFAIAGRWRCKERSSRDDSAVIVEPGELLIVRKETHHSTSIDVCREVVDTDDDNDTDNDHKLFVVLLEIKKQR